MEKYKDYIKQCLEEGCDKYIVINNVGKEKLKDKKDIRNKDLVLAKIILTYKDKKLGYVIKEYKHPFNITERLKHKNSYGKYTFFILYFPDIKKYAITNPENEILFDSIRELKTFFNLYWSYPIEDRNFFYGITK